jgi:hypothetical protein
MIGKKINQLATELAPVSTDLTIIGDPISGVSKKITLAQLGAIFSGAVSFYTNLASFPATGDINVIYCAKDTQKLYLWSGSAYTEVFPSQALLDTYQLRSEKGVSNGYASLDSGGKVPISQLPSSIMEYKGTWNAATNTPTLANGTGDTGDVYICNVAGTVNFGAGPITFAVGDYVIYSGTIWQRSSGAVGTVTSVALTVGGDAISVSGSPLTTSGTLGLTFNGTTAQYIRGNGTLETFPTSLISGSGASGQVTFFNGANSVTGTNNFFWDATNNRLGIGTTTPQRSIEIYNTTADNHLRLSGNAPSVSMGEAVTGSIYQAKFGLVTTNGQFVSAGVAGDFVIISQTGATIIGTSSTEKMRVNTSGNVSINNTNNTYKLDVTGTGRFTGQLRLESTITDGTNTYTLPSATGTLALTSQIPSVTGYVPYTGATANVDLGTHTLIAAKGTFSSSGSGDTVGVTHSSGSGIALNITKGGSGEGLYINKTSGSGNAATIIGTLNATTLVKSGGTSAQFLKADGSVDSTSYGTGSVTSVGLSSATSGVTIGSTPITTSGTITLAIATASGSQQGLLSSTDWTTFNNKQNALTNPVTGTGTTNYLPKFTGASTIGNSAIFENGTNVGINTASPSSYTNLTTLTINGTNGSVIDLKTGNTLYGEIYSLANELRIDAVGASSVLKFLTNSVTRATLDASGNLGLGVTPSAWGSIFTALQIKNTSISAVNDIVQVIAGNSFYNGTAYAYIQNGFSNQLEINNSGSFLFKTAPSGTAGNAISFTQAMTLDASGRLGIGTTSPQRKLHVTSSMMLSSGSAAQEFLIGDDNVRYFSLQTPSGAANLQFNVYGGSNIMTMTSGGNVGIGTTAPTNTGGYATLTVGGATSTLGQITWNSGTTAIGYAYNDGTNMNIGSNAALIFATTSGATERMRITSGGNLLVGTTTDDGYKLASVGQSIFKATSLNSITAQRLSTDGTIITFYKDGTLVGSISTNANSLPSDLNFKKNINNLDLGLNLINKLRPVSYNHKIDDENTALSTGFIAQELEKSLNELGVKENQYHILQHTPNEDKKQSQYWLDYTKIIPVLVKAIQEQQTQIEQLKNK